MGQLLWMPPPDDIDELMALEEYVDNPADAITLTTRIYSSDAR